MKPAPPRPHAEPSAEARRPASHVAPPAEAAPPAAETPARSKRTTYIPPRPTRPVGRHGRGQHKRAERFNDGPPGPSVHGGTFGDDPVCRAIPAVMRPARLMEGATVREFAEGLDIKPKDVVASLLRHGVMATINQQLDARVALDVGRRFGYEVSFSSFEDLTVESEFELAPEMMEDTERRAPIVTVMGHVDHGKTSLLDAIRESRVAEGEAGGITQRIGAYSVEAPNPDDPSETRRVVFLDTPGHEAFTMMRARGAGVTDIVVLVVAADDGVMPQTVEAIDHAKAADVPIVVAINKIDKPEANPERVKKELADRGLLWDGWGGDTTMVEVSAKKRQNVEGLLEMVLLTADILDLKSNPKRKATGTVLEAKLDRGRGPVATALIQNGTLRVGDPFIAGDYFGRVRRYSTTGAGAWRKLPGDAGRGDRGGRRSGGGRPVSGRSRRGEGASDFRPPSGQRASREPAAHGGARPGPIARADGGGRSQGIAGHPQGGRARLCRGGQRCFDKTLDGQSQSPRDSRRRRRDHRIGRAPGERVERRGRRDHRFQRAARSAPKRRPERRRWRSGCTRSFTKSRRRFATPCRGCSPR